MPESDLLGLLQPPPPAITQVSPMGQLGAVLSGLGAGMQGQPNPVLGQLQSQQDAQFRQQVLMMQLRQSVERQRMAKLKIQSEFADDLLKSSDPVVREFGAKTKGELLTQLGLHPSPAVISGLVTKSVSAEDMKRAGRYLDLFGGDANKAAELSGLSLSIVQDLAKGQQSDAYSQLIYGKSKAQRQKETVDLRHSTYTTWAAQHPMEPSTAAEAAILASEKFPGQSLDTLVDDDRNAIVRLAQQRVTDRDIAKEQRKLADQKELARAKANFAQLRTQIENQQVATLATHGIRLLDRKGNEYTGNPLDRAGTVIAQGYEPVKDAMAKDLRAGKQSFRIFGNMRSQAAVLAQKGLLTKTAEIYDQAARTSPDYAVAHSGDPGAMERLALYVKFNIGKFTREPDILTWAGMESEMIISLRNLGEKGVRAMQGFAGAVGVMKGGQFSAIDQYIRNLELITVAQFDRKWEAAFETRYIAKPRKGGVSGTLTLRPGEAFDLGEYQIMTEFGLPAR